MHLHSILSSSFMEMVDGLAFWKHFSSPPTTRALCNTSDIHTSIQTLMSEAAERHNASNPTRTIFSMPSLSHTLTHKCNSHPEPEVSQWIEPRTVFISL